MQLPGDLAEGTRRSYRRHMKKGLLFMPRWNLLVFLTSAIVSLVAATV